MGQMRRTGWIRRMAVFLGCVGILRGTQPLGQAGWLGAELFKGAQPRRMAIEIAPEGISSLREQPREFVRAVVSEGGTNYSGVGVHLKGASGSFRPVDDKPALTLDFSRFNKGQRFHGLRRIHLNNSVEDPSYLCEQVGGELFRAAGVPAPRVTHAVVMLNGRRLGLYALVEGFTEDFLGCYFRTVSGDLYEPRAGHDIGRRLKRNSVDAPKRGHEDFAALAEAAKEPDLSRRWERLEQALDMERFLKFMALEVMLCQGDGYCISGNNYRVYEELEKRRILFFPHGMDRLFGSPELPLYPRMSGLVAKAVMETEEGRRQYEACCGEILANVFDCETINQGIGQAVSGLAPSLTKDESRDLKEAAEALQRRIASREEFLEQQLTMLPDHLARLTNGICLLKGWKKGAQPGIGQMRQGKCSDGTDALEIQARDVSASDWRTQIKLEPGRYRFEGRVKALGVKGLSFAGSSGARLRVAGSGNRSVELLGDSGWRTLSVDFEVERSGGPVELLCELRAAGGQAWFDANSLLVRRLR